MPDVHRFLGSDGFAHCLFGRYSDFSTSDQASLSQMRLRDPVVYLRMPGVRDDFPEKKVTGAFMKITFLRRGNRTSIDGLASAQIVRDKALT